MVSLRDCGCRGCCLLQGGCCDQVPEECYGRLIPALDLDTSSVMTRTRLNGTASFRTGKLPLDATPLTFKQLRCAIYRLAWEQFAQDDEVVMGSGTRVQFPSCVRIALIREASIQLDNA